MARLSGNLTVFYRYFDAILPEEFIYSDSDDLFATGELITECKPSLREFKVVKETTAGYWIRKYGDYGPLKWFGKSSRYKFAQATKEDALKDYIWRKMYSIRMLNSRLRQQKRLLYIAENTVTIANE